LKKRRKIGKEKHSFLTRVSVPKRGRGGERVEPPGGPGEKETCKGGAQT